MRNDWEQSPSSSVTTLDTSDSQVFDDKNLEVLKKNDWGGGGKKFPKNWTDLEKAFNERIRIMSQKVQCQLLAGRSGVATGSQGGWR
jgi:hypothetical protein